MGELCPSVPAEGRGRSPPSLCGQPCPQGGSQQGAASAGVETSEGKGKSCRSLSQAQTSGVHGVKGFVWLGSSSEGACSEAVAVPLFVFLHWGEQVYFYLRGFHCIAAGSGSVCSAEGLVAVGLHTLNTIKPSFV